MNVELDYAFLAQWARVNADGTLTAVDASFLRVFIRKGGMLPLAIAGRVRFLEPPYEADLTVELKVGNVSLDYSGHITASEASAYGKGRRHSLFALTTQVPINEYGEHIITVKLNGGEQARTLIFTAVGPEGD